jgi:cell division protein FtsB
MIPMSGKLSRRKTQTVRLGERSVNFEMHDSGERDAKKTLLHRWEVRLGIALLWIAACTAISLSLMNKLKTVFGARSYMQQVAHENEKITEQNQQIRADIETAKTPFDIERRLRDELGLQKEGETVYVIPIQPNTNGSDKQDTISGVVMGTDTDQEDESILTRIQKAISRLFGGE